MSNTRDNSGSMSRNERKEKPTHADYKGKAMIDGREYWISAWIKENERGKWLSLAFDAKDAQPQRQAQPAQQKGATLDDEIPF